jgi:hypothetical protein
MTQAKAEKKLDALFSGAVSGFGFNRVEMLTYVRGAGDRSEIIRLAGRLRGEVLFFNIIVGVRFEKVARLMKRQHPERNTPTFSSPIHLLRETRTHTDWELGGILSDNELISEVTSDIEHHAFPFLERFQSISDLEASLKSENPIDWHSVSPQQRVCLLAAVAALNGYKCEASHILETALDSLKDSAPGKRVLLEELRKELSVKGE